MQLNYFYGPFIIIPCYLHTLNQYRLPVSHTQTDSVPHQSCDDWATIYLHPTSPKPSMNNNFSCRHTTQLSRYRTMLLTNQHART